MAENKQSDGTDGGKVPRSKHDQLSLSGSVTK